jgi:hypothetical protein
MAIEAEKQTVVFTDEAEISLRRALHRTESRLRTAAIEEAVRRRGFPAEVTGSDVSRATRVALGGPSPTVEERNKFVHSPIDEFMKEQQFIEQYREFRKPFRRTGTIDAMARVYGWFGAVLTFAGVLIPSFYTLYKSLSHDFAWRIGLMISATGIIMALLSLLLREFSSKFLRTHRDERSIRSKASAADDA